MRKRRAGLFKAVICSICCVLLMGLWVFSTRIGFGTQIGFFSGAVEDGVLHIYGGGQWVGPIPTGIFSLFFTQAQKPPEHTWDAKGTWGWELPRVAKGFMSAPEYSVLVPVYIQPPPGNSAENNSPPIGQNNLSNGVLGGFSPTINYAQGVVSGNKFVIDLPLWVMMMVSVLATVLLWRRFLARLSPELCQQCGYNLTGNISGICPECGEERIKDKG